MSFLRFRGDLEVYKIIKTPWGRLMWTRDKGEGIPVNLLSTSLFVENITTGETFDLGSGLVTNAGVNLLAADWTNATSTLKLSNFHDSGTGTSPASITDTALGIPTGISRVAGVQSNINNVYSSVAVITYNATYQITEWGLFTATSGPTLWDRRSFSSMPISVKNNDQLKWVYFLTVLAGG